MSHLSSSMAPHDVRPDHYAVDLIALHHPRYAHQQMGAHPVSLPVQGERVDGIRFIVFAPHASAVSVIGDWNQWQAEAGSLIAIEDGFWVGFVAHLGLNQRYKYALTGPDGQPLPHKADPYGVYAEPYPSFASLTYDQTAYSWGDQQWQHRPITEKHRQALSFYELHLGSWQHDENGQVLNYRELAARVVPYLVDMGYTHVELMPVSEHPFYGSWGYQPVGLFAPTSRYGSPDDFKYFVDQCHQAGIGVILDWVPGHFPTDDHGLAYFDGTPLYHDPDPRRGWHNDWQCHIYDMEQHHVRRFLVNNALYWLDQFHIDGLRVDAVASMLYLDYSREHDQWLPNANGGNENDDAIATLKWMNESVYHYFPNAMTIAEESTTFPGVSAPIYAGGLGFGFKWNMGWMNDSLRYIREEPVYRRYHHDTLTFPLVYAFSENYVLPLSHDEVVYGKGSLMGKMPGDEWQQTANLRAYLGYMYGQPGKKLNFMGTEIGQTAEWDHDSQLEWHWLQYDRHQGIQTLVKALNDLYVATPALYRLDCDPAGFEWRINDAADISVMAHERVSDDGSRVLVVSNFTPVPRDNFQLGVPNRGTYELALNTDDKAFWGSGYAAYSSVVTEMVSSHQQPYSLTLNLPPLATVFYRWQD